MCSPALGSANLKLGRIGQAEALLRQALDEEEDFVPALNNLGVVLMEQREYGEARRVFQKAFALDSGRTDRDPREPETGYRADARLPCMML